MHVVDDKLVILLLLEQRALDREPWLKALQILLVRWVYTMADGIRDGAAMGA